MKKNNSIITWVMLLGITAGVVSCGIDVPTADPSAQTNKKPSPAEAHHPSAQAYFQEVVPSTLFFAILNCSVPIKAEQCFRVSRSILSCIYFNAFVRLPQCCHEVN